MLGYVQMFIQEQGTPPTLGEIAEGHGWSSKATAHRHVEALITAGRLARSESGMLRLPRSGVLRQPKVLSQGVPMVDRMLPGRAEIGPGRIVTHVPPPPLRPTDAMFAFTPDDDGLLAAGIAPGCVVYAELRGAAPLEAGLVAVVRGQGKRAAPLVVRRFFPAKGGTLAYADEGQWIADSKEQDLSRVVGVVKGWYREA